MKKITSALLVLATMFTIVFCLPMTVSAATTGFDILNSSKYARVYTLASSGKTTPYKDAELKTPGSVTYGASSSAYIDNAADELYLIDVGVTNGVTWAKVTYPIGSKRATAYIPLSAISANTAKHQKTTSTGKYYCAVRKGASVSTSYYVAKGDSVYLLAVDGSKCQILYPISDGKYRIAWCSKTDYEKYNGIAVTSVSLNKTSSTLNGKDKTVSLSATVKPSNATDSEITWKTSNASIAKVSSTGKVTAVGSGTATITAVTNNGKKATAKITVNSVSATKVTLSASSFTLKGKGSTKTLTATITPSNSTDKITWKSSNTAVATVNSSGKVTAVANGTAIITATTTSGKNATAKVTVKITPATKVTLNSTSFTLSGVGSTKSLTATMTPSDSTDKITWTSSDTSVATVNSSGKVTAVANGTATITATATSGKKATAKVTVKDCSKITYSFSATTTSSTKSSSSTLKVNGTNITVGSTFYTYNKSGTVKTTGSNYSTYPYVKVGSSYVNVGATQCFAYARYVQYLLYGCTDYNSSKFTKVSGASGTATASNIKNWVNTAGVGAHIRSTRPHSLIVIGIDSKGFYYTDANSDGAGSIRVGYYTWSGFASSNYKNIEYIKYYNG